jgi:histone demethylase JARID1
MSDDMMNLNSSINTSYSKMGSNNSLGLSYATDQENHQQTIDNLNNESTNESNDHLNVHQNNEDEFVIAQSMLSSFESPAKNDLHFNNEREYTNAELLEATAAAAAAVAATIPSDSPSNLNTDEQSNKRNYSDILEDTSDMNNKKQQITSIDDLNFKMENIDSSYISNSQNSMISSSINKDTSSNNALDLFKQAEISRSKVIKFTPNRTSENIKKPHLFLTNPNNKKTRKELTKGPPKNSRFFKVYNLDGSKTSKTSSIHHYNPYRYPQNRSKLNPNPDFIKSKRDKRSGRRETANFAKNGNSLNTEGTLSKEILDSIPKYVNDELPELRPTMYEFEDIYTYIESIKEIGEKYGAVKIIPPKEFSPKFAINLESFWIKSNRQLWRTSSDELNSRFEFYRQLKEALSAENVSISKLPCIDKRVIDLYRLCRVVRLRGGYETCCNDKLWAQVGRELGFYGKISSSLSSSIKTVYQKYLMPWENAYADKHQDFLNLVRNDEANSLFSKEKFLSESPEIPIILGSSITFRRDRQLLLDAGFPTYYDQSTTQKRGITMNEIQTLPAYDFYKWNKSNAVDDIDPTDLKISSLYTLKQFYDKSRILKNQLLTKFNESEHYKFENKNYLENTFWNLLNNPEIMFETEVSLRQPTNIHDSSSENRFLSDKNGNLSDSILGSLNFNNSAICDGSMLQYTDSFSDSMYHSYLNFCMFYGAQSWSAEDHWFYNIDYHYLGDAKSYYVIPPEDQEKYEELVKSKLDMKIKESERTTENVKLFEKEILNYDIQTASLENQVCYDMNLPRARPNDFKFDNLMEPGVFPLRYNTDIMFSPEYLKENGIKVYHTFQEVGDMIIKFPRAYSSYFSLGTCVTESVNIANADWLKHSLSVSKWFQKQSLLPRFSTFSMLITAARESTDYKSLCGIKPILDNLVTEELRKRNELRILMKEIKFNEDSKILNNMEKIQSQVSNLVIKDSESETVGTKLAIKLGSWNKVTDADLADIFPTFVLLKHPGDKQSSFTISLDFYLEKRKDIEFQSMNYSCEMISLVSDEYLHETIEILNNKMESLDQWIEKYNHIICEYPKPPLEKVLPLIEHGKTLFNEKTMRLVQLEDNEKEIYENFVNLKNEVKKTERWLKKAKCVLDFNIDVSKNKIPFEDFKVLVFEINSLNIICKEIDEILEISKEVLLYDRLATIELDKGADNLNIEELKKLQVSGSHIKIDLDTYTLINKIVKRYFWVKNLKREISTLDEMKEIYEQGKNFESSNPADIELLKDFKKKIDKAEIVSKEFEKFKAEDAKVSYASIVELNKESVDLPLLDVKRYIRNLINEHKHISEIVLPVIKTLEEKRNAIESEPSFPKKVEKFLKYSETLAKRISTINLELTYKTLCKFEEYEKESNIFLQQLIEGPRIMFGQIHKDFKNLLSFGKDDFKFSNMNESECLNYLVSYDLDILNSNDDRYCVCRQMHEGNMVECEKCKQWFHFNCIGYISGTNNNEDDNKYICPLCDTDKKFSTTHKFFASISRKITFDQLYEFSLKLINDCSISVSYENTFLQITVRYYNFLKETLLNGKLLEELKLEDGSRKFLAKEKDLSKLRKTLEKINGCVINYDKVQSALCNAYYGNGSNEDDVAAVPALSTGITEASQKLEAQGLSV